MSNFDLLVAEIVVILVFLHDLRPLFNFADLTTSQYSLEIEVEDFLSKDKVDSDDNNLWNTFGYLIKCVSLIVLYAKTVQKLSRSALLVVIGFRSVFFQPCVNPHRFNKLLLFILRE